MRVIDSHVHFPFQKKEEVKPEQQPNRWLVQEREKWRKAWRLPDALPAGAFEECVSLWEQETEKHAIDKIVFVTAESNDQMVEVVKKNPQKFVGYAHHDPTIPHAAEILEDYVFHKGLKGYKILAPAVQTPLNDKKLYPVWEIAQKASIPVLVHFGIMGAAGGIASHVNMNPLMIHDVAKAFPQIPFIIPHFGCGYLFETLNLCWACPNVFIDTSGSNQWMRWMPYEVNLEILFRKYRETIGAERIVFGTDSSWFPRGFAKAYLDEQVKAMVYCGYTESDMDNVLYKNIEDLLGGQ